jgi:hypothetical protein
MPSLGIAPALEVRPQQRHTGAAPGTGFMRLSGGAKYLPRLEIRVQAIQL